MPSMAYPFPKSSASPQTLYEAKEGHSARPDYFACFRPAAIVYKVFVLLYVVVALLILWKLRPDLGVWSTKQSDRIPYSISQSHAGTQDFLAHFEGRQECGFSSSDLYVPPASHRDKPMKQAYCPNRMTAIEAMSGGGRHGFDAPFTPKGCHYRWYTTEEICMILERFDAIIFIGDRTLQNIYSAFNILLRENTALGALKQWEMTESDMKNCRCDNQFINHDCSRFIVTSREDVRKHDGGHAHQSPYFCDRTSHIFLPITDSPASDELHKAFNNLVVKDPISFKPIPIIHSISLGASLSWSTATKSLDEWIALADATIRNTPYLWVGPVAAGHLKPPGKIMSEGNNALWHFTVEMAKAAKDRDVEQLGLYNMSMQAYSWDGSFYGEKVSLVQAMMVINWLSRLESS